MNNPYVALASTQSSDADASSRRSALWLLIAFVTDGLLMNAVAFVSPWVIHAVVRDVAHVRESTRSVFDLTSVLGSGTAVALAICGVRWGRALSSRWGVGVGVMAVVHALCETATAVLRIASPRLAGGAREVTELAYGVFMALVAVGAIRTRHQSQRVDRVGWMSVVFSSIWLALRLWLVLGPTVSADDARVAFGLGLIALKILAWSLVVLTLLFARADHAHEHR